MWLSARAPRPGQESKIILIKHDQTPPLAGPARFLSGLGLCLAALFLMASLTPSLAPRPPVLQGVASGIIAAIGYEIGLAIGGLWRLLELPQPRGPRLIRLRFGALALTVLVLLVAFRESTAWRNATRQVAGLAPLDQGNTLTIAAVALSVACLLWALFRLFWALTRRIETPLRRVVPYRIAQATSLMLGLAIFYLAIEGTAIRYAFRAADSTMEAADRFIDPDLPRPETPQKTGSPASLISWDQLGDTGRSYIATAPSAEEIAALKGAPALAPIRVYVGRTAARSAQARAELALRELIRVGGFDRSVLVVVSPTGTGWMDPDAFDTLDFLMGGDVATVAVQYSYLSSSLALAAHPELGVEQAQALFDVVHDYWSELPKDKRPHLYAFGLSLGAYNSQMTLPLLDMLGDPIQGALWVGSPFLSPMWRYVQDQRWPDSPPWHPRFGNGSLVRTMTQFDGPAPQATPWGPIRLIFLQYASDPIPLFSLGTALRRPDWLRYDRPADVSPQIKWVPVVSMLQTALDMLIALQVERFGHYYVAEDYLPAWRDLLDPQGWTAETTDRLLTALKARRAARE